MKKAQAAMEYLMTYGWALLAIVIVIGLLLYLNPFGVGEHCIGDTGLDCSNPMPTIQGGDNLVFTARSALASKIKVLQAACKSANVVPTGAEWVDIADRDVPVGGELKILASESVKCPGAQAGEAFQGYVFLQYRYDKDDAATVRSISARFKTMAN